MIDLEPFVAEIDAAVLAATQRVANTYVRAGAETHELRVLMQPWLAEVVAWRAAALDRLLRIALRHERTVH